MKHTFSTLIWLGLLLFVNIGFLGALEIELTGGVNNMTFHPDRITAHSVSTNYKKFQNYPYGFGDFHLKGEVSNKMDFDLNFSRDNILHNTLSGKIKTTSDYVNIEFGTFLGMTDNFGKPETGFLGNIQLAYPGLVFLFIGGSSSMGTSFNFLSDNTRETYEVKVGLWLPGIIPSLSINSKRYSNQHDESILLKDELTRIQLSVDLFAKNSSIYLTFDAGFETLSRSYISDYSAEITDELSAVFIGGNIKWQITKPLRLIVGLEIPFSFEAKEPMKAPDDRFKLYKFSGGISYTFFN